ncbi:F-box/kelch-repeat protein At3g23880-like [Vicia villosa]|uniref:F-box/kelch-repeat protein At3g23880-like n=1 Tax=Vicia villosa TaxID=3911 RepID=UPI00273AB44A|nr:F-box/kelch-repeat protein At3g23880-like [Vicia villosa]
MQAVKMNIHPSHSQHSSNTSQSVFLPNELVTEVLSSLPVKSFMRMRCLSKFSNSLFTDPIFIRMHLLRSARNPHLALVTSKTKNVVPLPVCHLLENPLITLTDEPHYLMDDVCFNQSNSRVNHRVVGSCNGLICLLIFSILDQDITFRFWNPSTRTISKALGHLCFSSDRVNRRHHRVSQYRSLKFVFGYDNLTSTYKVVSLNFQPRNRITETKVFSLVDNVWRNIQNFPAAPLQFVYRFHPVYRFHHDYDGVYLSGTANWLGVFEYKVKSLENYVIISLDLGTETYTQMHLPHGFVEMPRVDPTIGVLMNRLCFSYDFRLTHFVIWQMMDFGVQESWTQFLQINYLDLQISSLDSIGYNFRDKELFMVPLYLSENDDRLILGSSLEEQAILYNMRDNSVERTRITNKIRWFLVKEYVGSLVSTSE